MKKLLKIEVCGSCEQCMSALYTEEKSTTTAKKKKRENAQTENTNMNKLNPNWALVYHGLL